MFYQKKPVIIEARQLNASTRDEISRWINDGVSGASDNKRNLKAWFYDCNGTDELYIETLEGTMVASDGDWIIKGVEGEFYPCKPKIFEATYQRADAVRPIMWLDEKLPETHMAPIISETGEVWEEKQWELVELATEWRYESEDDLRKEALLRYNAAKEGVTFAEKPYFQGHILILGAAYAGAKPPEMVSCHPATWEKLPQAVKDKYDLRNITIPYPAKTNEHFANANGGCPPNCGHTKAEHLAFDEGVATGRARGLDVENPYDDAALADAWATGHSVGAQEYSPND